MAAFDDKKVYKDLYDEPPTVAALEVFIKSAGYQTVMSGLRQHQRNMDFIIRQETEKDYSLTEKVVEKAFANEKHSDHREQFLVAKLRKSEGFVPELSLVAEISEELVGHIMLTKLLIKGGEQKYESLALAPVSVLSEYQNKGIGSKLIHQSLRIAKEMGFKSVIVLGHDKYYPRFGFRPASIWGIKAPFEVPDESFMALELEDGSLDGITGSVVYGKEFFQ